MSQISHKIFFYRKISLPAWSNFDISGGKGSNIWFLFISFSSGSTFELIRIIFTPSYQIFSPLHFGAIFTSVGASIDLETNIGKFQRFLEITHFQINQFTRSKYFFGFQLLVFGVFHQCENFSISSVSFSPGTKGLNFKGSYYSTPMMRRWNFH